MTVAISVVNTINQLQIRIVSLKEKLIISSFSTQPKLVIG